VVLVGDVGLSRLIEALPIVMRGNIRWPEVTRFKARRFAVRANHAALIHGDGEILGRTPAEFEVIPGAIRVVLPR